MGEHEIVGVVCAPAEFDPRKHLGPAHEAMKQVCVERMVAFGQAGNAGKIKSVTCADMVSRYREPRRPV